MFRSLFVLEISEKFSQSVRKLLLLRQEILFSTVIDMNSSTRYVHSRTQIISSCSLTKGGVNQTLWGRGSMQMYAQTNNKWYAFELNSKFDKTYKTLFKSLITIWYRKKNWLIICIYYYFAISHFISLTFNVFTWRHIFYLWTNLSQFSVKSFFL